MGFPNFDFYPTLVLPDFRSFISNYSISVPQKKKRSLMNRTNVYAKNNQQYQTFWVIIVFQTLYEPEIFKSWYSVPSHHFQMGVFLPTAPVASCHCSNYRHY